MKKQKLPRELSVDVKVEKILYRKRFEYMGKLYFEGKGVVAKLTVKPLEETPATGDYEIFIGKNIAGLVRKGEKLKGHFKLDCGTSEWFDGKVGSGETAGYHIYAIERPSSNKKLWFYAKNLKDFLNK